MQSFQIKPDCLYLLKIKALADALQDLVLNSKKREDMGKASSEEVDSRKIFFN